jgi:hypothetical protein
MALGDKQPAKSELAQLNVQDALLASAEAGYSLIGVLASIARLRFTGSNRLTCNFHQPSRKGTFLLCQLGDLSSLP